MAVEEVKTAGLIPEGNRSEVAQKLDETGSSALTLQRMLRVLNDIHYIITGILNRW